MNWFGMRNFSLCVEAACAMLVYVCIDEAGIVVFKLVIYEHLCIVFGLKSQTLLLMSMVHLIHLTRDHFLSHVCVSYTGGHTSVHLVCDDNL
jgi:hypothetical protein